MKKNLRFLAMAVAIAASFILGRFYDRAGATAKQAADARSVEIVSPEYGALILLVDDGEVYCGKERAPKVAVEEYVNRTMELNHAKQFIVFGSDNARYGDAIALIGKLKKKGLSMARVELWPVASGVRLPVLYSRSFEMEPDSNGR